MNRRIRCVLVWGLFWVAVSGCVKKLDFVQTDQLQAEKVLTIQNGTTTKSDIITLFGEPYSTVELDKQETLFYKDENLKSLWIELDEKKVVTKYKYSKK